jgi:hypothetical protein
LSNLYFSSVLVIQSQMPSYFPVRLATEST